MSPNRDGLMVSESKESSSVKGASGDHLPVATIDVHKGTPVRLQIKVVVPTHDHPNYNFVGKLLGPQGKSFKWLQEQTKTKMAILGKGSMRNKEKEEELRSIGGPKYAHLNEDLHVEITTVAPAPEAYLRMSNALFEIKRFLVPDYYDEIRQQQLRELGVIGHEKTETLQIRSETTISPMIAPPLGGQLARMETSDSLCQYHHSNLDTIDLASKTLISNSTYRPAKSVIKEDYPWDHYKRLPPDFTYPLKRQSNLVKPYSRQGNHRHHNGV